MPAAKPKPPEPLMTERQKAAFELVKHIFSGPHGEVLLEHKTDEVIEDASKFAGRVVDIFLKVSS